MSEILFLFEILIKRIELDKTLAFVESKNEISFSSRFADFIYIDIALEDFLTQLEKYELIDNVEDIEINMGKTYLFTGSYTNILSEMKQSTLELSLCLNRKNEGTIFHKWKPKFLNMVKQAAAGENNKSEKALLTEEFRNDTVKSIGKCTFFLRFSCLGHHIQTSFYLNIQTCCNLYTDTQHNIFKCQNFDKLISDQEESPLFAMSWPSLTDAKDDDEEELVPDLFNYPLDDAYRDSEILDIVSLCFRPQEKKFFDLTQMVSAEVTTTAKGTCVTLTMEKQPKAKTTTSTILDTKPRINPFDTTEEKINKNLCKRADCPAALKLKQFGFGPLAKGKGLGTIYGKITPSISYGMSQTYGTFSDYGPYGVLVDRDQISPKKGNRGSQEKIDDDTNCIDNISEEKLEQ